MADRAGRRARIVTSLDIIEELHARDFLSAAERRTCRHRLRMAGCCLVPLDAGEIKFAARRNVRIVAPFGDRRVDQIAQAALTRSLCEMGGLNQSRRARGRQLRRPIA